MRRKAPTKRLKTRFLALEPRVVFDGALAVDIVDKTLAATNPDAAASDASKDPLSAPADWSRPAAGDRAVTEKAAADAQALRDANATDPAAQLAASVDPAAAIAPAPAELLFIEGGIRGMQQLINAARPGVEVIIIDPTRDGFSQITETLAGRTDIAAIHLVSHGVPGSVTLGDGALSLQSLAGHSVEVAGWRASLSPGADFLIYGCDAGEGSQGTALLAQLSSLTGADVAASNDPTGAGPLGGNWVLEVNQGQVTTRLFADRVGLEAFNSLLAAPVVDLNGPGTFNISDNFSSQTYAGGSNWLSGWVEFDASPTRAYNVGGSNSDNSPASGNIVEASVVGALGGQQEMVFLGHGAQFLDNISRAVNLQAYTSAILSFDYRTAGLAAGDKIQVEVSQNAGANFFSISTLANVTTNTTVSFDISNYISDNTVIRLSVKSGFATGTTQQFYFDNVNIAATGSNYYSTFTENAGVATPIVGGAALITDADPGQQLTSATITLTNSKAGDVLSIVGSLPVGITADLSVPNTVTLSGTASAATYATALQAIGFSNSTDTPDQTLRSISIRVTDAGTEQSVAVNSFVSVVAVDDPVTTVAHNYSTSTIGTLTGTVLANVDPAANDFDLDSAGLSVSTTLLTNPTKGTAVMNSDGSFTYTPTVGQTGTDSFQYKLVSLAQVRGTNYEYWSVTPPGWTATTGLAALAGNAIYTTLGQPVANGYLPTGYDVDKAAINYGNTGLDNFTVRFTNQLTVTTAGNYTLYAGSDDGAILYVDGVAVVNNDGAHSYVETAGAPVFLSAGTHTLVVDFFEVCGQEDLIVSYSGADTGNLKTNLNYVGGVLAPAYATGTVTINIQDAGPRLALGANLFASDDFSPQNYTGSDGSIGWKTNWTEAGDDASATAGKISVSAGGKLVIGDTSVTPTASVARTIDMLALAGSNPARVGTMLTLDYDATALTAGKVEIQMSQDNGVNWTTIGTLDSTTAVKVATGKQYDISNFAFDNAQLRFKVTQATAAAALVIDNVRIDPDPDKHSPAVTAGAGLATGTPVSIASATTAIA
ncbi:MAG: DUF4347 domain-containing protein, partial [Proteobacteria bacterium]|nr:DUF4347 domain-containing protein [Pseudomonadota bacterium]